MQKLLEQKLYLERAQGVTKLDVDIDVFAQNGLKSKKVK